MKVLVTGAAGFIGNHVALELLKRGDTVVGLDNMNAYYDVTLKQARLERLRGRTGFSFEKVDLADRDGMARLFGRHAPDRVVHLAAQAGVRYSIDHPHAYVDSNVVGFLHVLEGCRHHRTAHLVYASTSSVYGANRTYPLSEDQASEHPLTIYAATKKANEMMAHSHAHLYGIPTTGVRFFTVYGPWGRPDMALFKFTRAILDGKPIDVFNRGRMVRDFTYIDDVVNGVIALLDRVPTPVGDAESGPEDAGVSPVAPYRLYNIGNSRPTDLMRYIDLLERKLGRVAEKNMLPMQMGDVKETYADIDAAQRDFGFTPKVSIDEGLPRFVAWYRDHHGITE